MSYNDLENFFRTMFSMHQDFNVSISEYGNMTPWEREIYIALIEQRAREQENVDTD